LRSMLKILARFIATKFRLNHCSECMHCWRDSLRSMFAFLAWLIAANAYNFGVIHCSECLQFRHDALQRMPSISAWFIAANAYNFGMMHCSECLQFRRDSLQLQRAFAAAFAASAFIHYQCAMDSVCYSIILQRVDICFGFLCICATAWLMVWI
jgi:hypothetical protein